MIELEALQQENQELRAALTEARRRTIPLKDVKGFNGSLNFLPHYILGVDSFTPNEHRAFEDGNVVTVVGRAQITLTVVGEVVQTI
jgi:hypothetical protein